MRCAVYARYSSKEQSQSSIDDQIRECREFAARHGWQVVAEFRDEAASGRYAGARAGFQSMLAAAQDKPRAFDMVLCWKTDRFARNVRDARVYKEQLRAAGVRVHALNVALVEDEDEGGVIEVVHEAFDEELSRRIARDTRRGMIGIAHEGFWPGGGAPFGYRKEFVPEPRGRKRDGKPMMRAKLVPDPEQAPVLQRIFRDWGTHQRSYKSIAKALNDEGVPTPRKQAGRAKGWDGTAIRAMLFNPCYSGRVVFNRTRMVDRHRMKRRPVPREQWVIVKRAHPALVDFRLLRKIRQRQRTLERGYRGQRWPFTVRTHYPRNVLSQLIKCSECGANVVMVAGSFQKPRARMGCAFHHRRGNTVCSNRAVLRHDLVVDAIVKVIESYILTPENVERVLTMVHQRFMEIARTGDTEGGRLRELIDEKRSEIANLVRAIAAARMKESPAAVLGRIKELEEEVVRAEERLRAKRPMRPSVPSEARIRAKLADMGRVIREAPDQAEAREQIRQHFGGLYLDPDGRLRLEGSDGGLLRVILDSNDRPPANCDGAGSGI